MYVQLLWTLMGCKDLLNRPSDWSKYSQIKLEQRNNKLVQVQKIHLVSHKNGFPQGSSEHLQLVLSPSPTQAQYSPNPFLGCVFSSGRRSVSPRRAPPALHIHPCSDLPPQGADRPLAPSRNSLTPLGRP